MSCSTTTHFHHHHLPIHHRHLHHSQFLSRISCSSTTPKPHFNRRSLIFFSSTSTTLSSLSSLSLSSLAAQEENASATQQPQQQQQPLPPIDTTVTDRIFMDFSICPTYRSERTLGDELSTCQEIEPLGRVVFGLYGRILPLTVSHFKAMCTGSSGSSYKGTLVQKIFPNQYFIAGRQGRQEKGVVRPPSNLSMNTETLDSKAYALSHSRPGLLSLCLSENDDDDDIKLDPSYRNVEFLVTTGPGPCPMLDDRNIVFGTVLEGLDVVTTISSIPTYKPGERIRQFNDFAEFLGDERAQNARTIWNRPLKTIYISDCGELKVAKPSLSPTLP